jgi:hypothetical protein
VTVKRHIIVLIWFFTTTAFGWLIANKHHTSDSPVTVPVLIALLVCTLTLYFWLPNPISKQPAAAGFSRRGWFVLFAVFATGLLFLARTAIGPSLLFAWPLASIAILIYSKSRPGRKSFTYALVLSITTGVAALGAEWVSFHPVVWAILQVGIVLPGLLAGWELLRQSGLWQEGIGRSRFLDQGITPALKRVLSGIALAMPWALGVVLVGAAESETWVQAWWQPFTAINPGIGEEVWGRILPVPLMFLLLRKVTSPKKAYMVAMLVMNYWFAYVHTPGGLDGVISTIMIGTVFTLPLSILCLHRDLETAIGFHFWTDFVKFMAALLLNRGIWFI